MAMVVVGVVSGGGSGSGSGSSGCRSHGKWQWQWQYSTRFSHHMSLAFWFGSLSRSKQPKTAEI